MRALAALVLWLWAGAAPAQQEPGQDAAAIIAEVEAGLALLEAGDTQSAFNRLNAANELAQTQRPRGRLHFGGRPSARRILLWARHLSAGLTG